MRVVFFSFFKRIAGTLVGLVGERSFRVWLISSLFGRRKIGFRVGISGVFIVDR